MDVPDAWSKEEFPELHTLRRSEHYPYRFHLPAIYTANTVLIDVVHLTSLKSDTQILLPIRSRFLRSTA
jgi:hypothetical protein